MKRWTVLLLALLIPVFATHTAGSIFGLLPTALEQEGEDYFLLQAQVYFFENENDEHLLRLGGERGAGYKVVADGEVLENIDVSVTDTSRGVYSEKDPGTLKAKTSFTSGGQILIRLVAKNMPSNEGYTGVLVLRK